MGSELKRLVREAAGALGERVAARARAIGRLAHAQAGRVWRDVGELLRLEQPQAAPAPAAPAGDRGPRPFDPAQAEPNVALGPSTIAIVATMADVLSRSGYRELRADVPDCEPPEIVRGTVRSHRPSLTAVGGGCPVLVDVFVPGEISPEEQLSRWHLFASAAAQCGGEFHVVVPAWIDGMGGRAWTRRLGESTGLSVHHVWEI